MNLISKFLHTRLKVKEMERSLRFYIQVLGLKKVRSTVSPRGAKLVYLKVPEGEEELELTCFMNETGFSVPEDLMHIAFQVENMKAFERHISDFGIQFSDGPHVLSSGSIIAFVNDPDGYEIELVQLPLKA